MPDAVAAIVSVASNIEPEENIPRALAALVERATIEALSLFYVTAPIGRPEQDHYYNGAVRLRHQGGARRLKLDVLRPIEDSLGRVRTGDRYAPRPIDLDLLLYGMQILEEPDLALPDPSLLTRPFLAVAAAEVALDPALPGMGTSLDALASSEARAGLTPAAEFSRLMKERFLP
ncbi:MAG: 2-amino-4-hydroxy-6-hydroxymethyldihydropteridine diphosphokinase [Polyangia bacterium]|jgi:2-amino-4-hydroxy-6-hydroxymethyldihydropteridine diphosphokinase|nr:2-amino-4-hydroxy-6-hydroxymethyldihydropteridine diphosphokinase [Polyangia bacterium]